MQEPLHAELLCRCCQCCQGSKHTSLCTSLACSLAEASSLPSPASTRFFAAAIRSFKRISSAVSSLHRQAHMRMPVCQAMCLKSCQECNPPAAAGRSRPTQLGMVVDERSMASQAFPALIRSCHHAVSLKAGCGSLQLIPHLSTLSEPDSDTPFSLRTSSRGLAWPKGLERGFGAAGAACGCRSALGSSGLGSGGVGSSGAGRLRGLSCSRLRSKAGWSAAGAWLGAGPERIHLNRQALSSGSGSSASEQPAHLKGDTRSIWMGGAAAGGPAASYSKSVP